jgi:hypothetical protein
MSFGVTGVKVWNLFLIKYMTEIKNVGGWTILKWILEK